MLYRRSGIRHTDYAADRALFPIPADRVMVAALLVFALLTFFMADVQPIWSVIDCAGRVGVLFMTRTLTDLRTP